MHDTCMHALNCVYIYLKLSSFIRVLFSRAAVDCGVLQPPLNGQVMVFGTTLGSQALYNCDEGYILLGSTSRVCESNGRWSGDEPECSGG